MQGRIDLAGAYEFAEMAPEALRQYEKALRVRRDQPEPLLGLSQVYKRYARYKDSLKQLEEALAIEPRNAFYQFKLAEILREIGDKEAALTAARLAVSLAPVDPFYHYWVGDLLIEMRQFDVALEALRAALELSPGDDYLYLRTASAFWGAGRQQEAVKAIFGPRVTLIRISIYITAFWNCCSEKWAEHRRSFPGKGACLEDGRLR